MNRIKNEPVMSSAALVVVILWVSKQLGVDLPNDVAVSLSVLILGLAGWARQRVTPTSKQ